MLLFELLHPQVGHAHGAGVGSNPVDGLLGVVTVALDPKVVLAVVSQVALGVGAEAGSAGTLGHVGRVRPGQGHGADGVLDNVETLEASGGRALRGEAQSRGGIGTRTVDYRFISIHAHALIQSSWDSRMRISLALASPPKKMFSASLASFFCLHLLRTDC